MHDIIFPGTSVFFISFSVALVAALKENSLTLADLFAVYESALAFIGGSI